MTGEVTTRTATMADYSAVFQLVREVNELHVRICPDVFQSFDESDQHRDHIARIIDDPDSEIFLADVGTKAVGLATVTITDSPDAPMFRPRQTAVMDSLVVNQQFQGMGVGKRLLDCVVQWAQSRSIPSIVINVWVDNESGMEFYKAKGFKPLCQKMELRRDDTT